MDVSTRVAREPGGFDLANWKMIFQELAESGRTFTVYLRYVQKDTLAKIPNVKVSAVYEDHVRLENPSGFGILGYEDVLYISVPR